jgi:hypothetical protein
LLEWDLHVAEDHVVNHVQNLDDVVAEVFVNFRISGALYSVSLGVALLHNKKRRLVWSIMKVCFDEGLLLRHALTILTSLICILPRYVAILCLKFCV